MTYFQKIVILCPASIRANWGNTPISDLFVGNNIQLRIQPNNYARIEEGEKSKTVDYFNGVGRNVAPQRIGFNIAIQDRRDELLLAIKELAALSIPTKYRNFKPVVIYDYIRLEDLTDYQRGYTIRIGELWAENLTGTVRRGELICASPPLEFPQAGGFNEGFNLRFLSLYKEVQS